MQKTVIERSAAAIEATTIHGAAVPKPPSGASVPRNISRPCNSSSSALVAATPHEDIHAACRGTGRLAMAAPAWVAVPAWSKAVGLATPGRQQTAGSRAQPLLGT